MFIVSETGIRPISTCMIHTVPVIYKLPHTGLLWGKGAIIHHPSYIPPKTWLSFPVDLEIPNTAEQSVKDSKELTWFKVVLKQAMEQNPEYIVVDHVFLQMLNEKEQLIVENLLNFSHDLGYQPFILKER